MGEMKSKCPTVAITRWLSMGKVVKWFVMQRDRLIQHFDTSISATAPSASWWLLLLVVNDVTSKVNATFTKLQGRTTTISTQSLQLVDLSKSLSKMVSIVPFTDMKIPFQYYVSGDHAVLFEHLNSFVAGISVDASMLLSKLNNVEKENLYSTIAEFMINFFEGVCRIVATRDSSNNALVMKSVPVVPYDLVRTNQVEFMKLVASHKPRLEMSGWDGYSINAIGDQFKTLLDHYERVQTTKDAIDRYNHTKNSFQDAWNDSCPSVFPNLVDFCSGLATLFPNTASVESDFSIINQEKSTTRASLSNFTLEGILQSKQHARLADLYIRLNTP